MIKAITLYQPWAEAIMMGLKHYETRSWGTKYRGRLVIHAAAGPPMEDAMWHLQDLCAQHGCEIPVGYQLRRGEVLGVVDLVDCVQMTPELIAKQGPTERALGDWQVGRWAWKVKNPREVNERTPWKGMQRIWTYTGPDNFAHEFKLEVVK